MAKPMARLRSCFSVQPAGPRHKAGAADTSAADTDTADTAAAERPDGWADLPEHLLELLLEAVEAAGSARRQPHELQVGPKRPRSFAFKRRSRVKTACR